VKDAAAPDDHPRVSILLPARNAAPTLPDALASLSRQTLKNWECVLVDDASDDATGELAEQWAREDSRVRVIHLPAHGGIVAALNAAVRAARGSYLARQDADDRSHPRRLEKTLALLEADPRLAAVSCQVRLFPEESVLPGLRAYGEWLNRQVSSDQIARAIWVESPLPHPAVVMRREALQSCGGYRETPWPEDYDLWLRMHRARWRFGKVPEVLYDWRHGPGRLTFADPRYSPEAFLGCKIHHLRSSLEGRPLLIWGAGRDGKRLARALREEGLRPRAFIDIDPRKIGRTRQGLPTLSAEALSAEEADGSACSDGAVILVAVGTKGARRLIRGRLQALGFSEGADFFCLH
jgi:glycosyltransferase involved in cell wall biosynthesis